MAPMDTPAVERRARRALHSCSGTFDERTQASCGRGRVFPDAQSIRGAADPRRLRIPSPRTRRPRRCRDDRPQVRPPKARSSRGDPDPGSHPGEHLPRSSLSVGEESRGGSEHAILASRARQAREGVRPVAWPAAASAAGTAAAPALGGVRVGSLHLRGLGVRDPCSGNETCAPPARAPARTRRTPPRTLILRARPPPTGGPRMVDEIHPLGG